MLSITRRHPVITPSSPLRHHPAGTPSPGDPADRGGNVRSPRRARAIETADRVEAWAVGANDRIVVLEVPCDGGHWQPVVWRNAVTVRRLG